jgi:hypothetical protein
MTPTEPESPDSEAKETPAVQNGSTRRVGPARLHTEESLGWNKLI